MTVHAISVEIFQSGAKLWTDQPSDVQANISIPRATQVVAYKTKHRIANVSSTLYNREQQ